MLKDCQVHTWQFYSMSMVNLYFTYICCLLRINGWMWNQIPSCNAVPFVFVENITTTPKNSASKRRTTFTLYCVGFSFRSFWGELFFFFFTVFKLFVIYFIFVAMNLVTFIVEWKSHWSCVFCVKNLLKSKEMSLVSSLFI